MIEQQSPGPPVIAVVLAAGMGKRMRSATPKVLHRVAGRPLLGWVFETARAVGCERILCVVGHQAELVREELAAPDVEWVLQKRQLGTGHALAQVEGYVSGAARLLVLSGDVPLVSTLTLEELLARAEGAWGSLAVARLAEPGSLGRVVRNAGDETALERLVESADASPEELALHSVNAGIYVLPAPEVFAALKQLGTVNAQGELYLTDAVSAAVRAGETVRLYDLVDTAEAFGVNNRADLVRVRRALHAQKAASLLEAGVTLWDPERTIVDPQVEIGRDSELEADVTALGETRIGEGCHLGQGVWIRDSTIGSNAVIEPYSVLDRAVVGEGAKVGPYARLRPGANLGRGSKVGNFVEVKNTNLGAGAKASHLAYLGDADIGEGANIGAGAVTCNYDGAEKHRTTIGARSFVGSDTMLVAPVSLGEEATTAAGSVITDDVPAGALGIGRSKQRNLDGWAERRNRRRQKKTVTGNKDKT